MIKKDDVFFESIKKIAIPVTIQNIISSSLNLVDVIMLGSLGSTVISGVGLANQFFMIFFLAIFGITNGAQIYLSQFFGEKSIDKFHKAMGSQFLIGAIVTTIFFLVGAIFPKEILMIYSKDPEVIKIGTSYLRVIAFTFPLHLGMQSFFSALRSTGDATLPMIITATALISNTILNYLLIFGNFGFPKLGYFGAAVATFTSASIGLILNVIIIIKRKNIIYAKISEYFNFTKSFLQIILKASVPVMTNEMLWALGFSLYSLSFSRYSTDAYAAYQVFSVVNNIMFSTGIGLAISASVTLGNMLGANDIKAALSYEKKFTKAQFIVSILSAVILFLLSGFIADFFNVSDEIKKNASLIMKVGAVYIPIKFYTLLHIVGTFRSGGDVKYSILTDLGTLYLIGVPMAFISLHVFNAPLYIAQALIATEEIGKTIFCYLRIRSQKWANNLTHNKDLN